MGESRIERVGDGLELPPKLSLVRVTARTIGEAMDRARKNGAGDDELEEIHAYLNKHRTSETANQWRPTLNFFPNARRVDGEVPYVGEGVRDFWRRSYSSNVRWDSRDRAVVKD